MRGGAEIMKKLFTPLLLCSCIAINTAFADTERVPTTEKYILIDAINKTINQPKFSAIINKTGLFKVIKDMGDIGTTPTGLMTACIATIKGVYDSRKNDCYNFVKAAITEHNTMVRNKTLAANANVRPIGQKVYSIALGNEKRKNKEYYMADCSGEYAKKLAKCVFKTQTNKLVCGFAPERAGKKYENASGCLPYANHSDDFEDGFMWVWDAPNSLFDPGLYAVEYNSHGISVDLAPNDPYENFVSNVFKETPILSRSYIIFDQYLTAHQSIARDIVDREGRLCAEFLADNQKIDTSKYPHIRQEAKTKLYYYNDLYDNLLKLSNKEKGTLQCDNLREMYAETRDLINKFDYIEKQNGRIIILNKSFIQTLPKTLQQHIERYVYDKKLNMMAAYKIDGACTSATSIIRRGIFDGYDIEEYFANPNFTCRHVPKMTDDVIYAINKATNWLPPTTYEEVSCSNDGPGPQKGIEIRFVFGDIEEIPHYR